jgi:hypothetical protein
MKLMDKIKNMFTEEVEDEVKPIKKDVIQVEIPAAKNETKKVEVPVNEVVSHPAPIPPEPPKKEEKFVFPVYFDDKDFDELEKPKEKAKPVVPVKEPYSVSKQQPPKEVKKNFKPSPVISPVYGILDKNYSRDSIVAKKKPTTDVRSYHATPTVDDVRRKAFGRLEDELENTLTYERKQSFFLNEDDQIKQEVDIIDELDLKEEAYQDNGDIDQMIDDHENMQTPSYRHGSTDDNMVEEELNKLDTRKDKMVESDLFNLIDSMYRGKEDE